ncbi:MAG: DUF3800 domain-containing protein [Nevskia sp.]|nr:DUF3800 domain-containing protein [Nevskia sp.]
MYFDESGNTGTDLLNPDQPVFALASTSLGRDASEELIGPLRQTNQVEAKYSKLKGTRKGRKALLAFANSPLLTEDSCIFMQADKLYYLITHLVDKIIEPVMHDTNFDLYAGDGHVALTNLFFYTGDFAFPNGHWLRLQKATLQVLRQLSPDSFENFRRTVNAALPHIPDSFDIFRTMLTMGAALIYESLQIFRGTNSFDPAVDIFIAIVNLWMQRHTGDLQIIHDRSKPLRHSEKLLRAMMTKIPARVVGYGNRKTELPLRVSELHFADSQSLPQLQVADVLAGMSIDCLLGWSGKRPSNEFHEEMKGSPIAKWGVRGMLPDPNMSRRNDPAPGEVNLVDGAAAFMRDVGFFKGRD